MSNRKFNIGRQSEQLLNEELFKMYESIRTLLARPENNELGPESNLHGALWLDLVKNELNYYDKDSGVWEMIFRDKFRIVDRLMDQFPPDTPVHGQLWINQGVLMFYDGSAWKPIKALIQDGSEINMATFEDFLIMSPLHPQGNSVVNNGEKGDNSQFLVPNTNVGKFFVDRQHKNDYEEINKVTLQYPKIELASRVPSWIHVNPGKLTNVKKRLFKIDKRLPQILVSAFNTEFYGFNKDSIFGHFLRPGTEEDGGDYIVTPDGIFLSYNAGQHFDYVLAITYEFSWIKSSGRLNRTDTHQIATSYYVGGFGGPINVFIEGYDLENRFYFYDTLTKVVNITDPNIEEDMEISILRSIWREYGLIRERTLEGKGIIKLRRTYVNPLVFVNGQALHSSLGDIEIFNREGIILVNGARREMSYCVMELSSVDDGIDMFLKSGHALGIIGEQGRIPIENFATRVPENEGLVLFVDGLLVKKEDVVRNYEEGYITVAGLHVGQEYILLHDKFHALLYDESNLHAALVVGRVDESLVFMNGHLLCNDTAIVTSKTPEEQAEVAVEGEIKLFLRSLDNRMEGDFMIWSEYHKKWQAADQITIDGIKKVANSYENGLNVISLNVPYTNEDHFEVYAYNFANTIEHPLIINSFEAENEYDFPINQHFIAGANSLQVFLNGVRQYYVHEYVDGSGFQIPERYTGKVTYIIEHPESGSQRACTREILRHTNTIDGTNNVYRTRNSLYPGRVTVYVSGLRMPKESYVILDNHTIMFKDRTNRLIGSKDNYPIQTILKSDGSAVDIERFMADEILIEIRQSFDRQERTITVGDVDTYDIDIQKYNLPKEIIEASDEILIFINGIFTGLRDNLGYIKNRAKGAITILDGSFVEMMNTDPLYVYFMLNHEKHLRWQELNGNQPYEPKINNVITLEWR